MRFLPSHPSLNETHQSTLVSQKFRIYTLMHLLEQLSNCYKDCCVFVYVGRGKGEGRGREGGLRH
jgi:hypothetical protein